MTAQDCPVCERTPHADYCERGWDGEPVSLNRAVKILFWIVALCFLGGAIVGLMSCSPATPVHGKHDCRQYGYHHHMNDTVGGK